MAEDLADQIDDYICVFEGAGDLTMDTFVMLLFALIVVVIALVFLSKLLYDKYVKKGTVSADGATTAATATGASTTVSSIGGAGALLPGVAAAREGSRLSEPKEVLASKKEALLAQARNGALGGGARVGGGFGGAGIGGGGGPKGGFGGGGGGGGTAILRKRISRKSPGPELTQKKRTVLPPSNINGSDMQSVQWAIHLFRWLYSDLVVVNKLLQDWVGTVNTALLSYVEQHEMIVEVVRVLPESLPPNMSSILCEPAEQPNEVELLFDLESTPVLQIKAFRSTNQKTEVSHYKATVSRLKTRMSIIINYFALKGEMKVEGFPDIKIHLNSIGPLKTANAQDEKKQSDLIVDLLTSSIRDVVYPIDFSIYSTCPRLMGEEPEEMLPLDYSGYGQYDAYSSYQDNAFNTSLSTSPKKLLVKVVKAEGLLLCSQPYCVVEMDEPAQKHQSAGKAGPNPFWDESFLFDLSNHSTELLFEVYDSVAVGNEDNVLAVVASESDVVVVDDNDDKIVVVSEDADCDRSVTVELVAPSNDPSPTKKEEEEASSPAAPKDVVDACVDKIAKLHDINISPNTDSAGNEPKPDLNPAPNATTSTTTTTTEPATPMISTTTAPTAENDASESVVVAVVQSEVKNTADDDNDIVESDIAPAISDVVTNDVVDDDDKKCAVSAGGFQKFLGLGLVGIDELANGPASTQILELQPRPYETETITGTLTVEFVFIDAPPAPAPRRQYMQQSFARDGLDNRMATNTPTQPAAILPGAGGMHTVSSAPTSPAKAGTGLTTSTSFSDRNKRFEAANTNRLPPAATDHYGLNGTKLSESTPVSPALSSASQSLSAATLSGSSPYDVNRTLDATKKPRNIFGTLRNKLSLSKKSKSLDNSQYSPTHVGQIHSASSTLSRGSTMDQRSIFKSLSRKSSISESSAVSGISNASGRTFVHEESTLLLETLENNILRHYLVPIEVALRQKAWKRKGVKLHIYNDHTFIAKHIKGGVLCHVCNRSILRRPGKQGYECRDCLIQCHKPCHVRTPQACPNPKILSVQLATLPVLIE
nr:uncharacterized protein LOC109623319 isoform X3 [Aedes albopictus]